MRSQKSVVENAKRREEEMVRQVILFFPRRASKYLLQVFCDTIHAKDSVVCNSVVCCLATNSEAGLPAKCNPNSASTAHSVPTLKLALAKRELSSFDFLTQHSVDGYISTHSQVEIQLTENTKTRVVEHEKHKNNDQNRSQVANRIGCVYSVAASIQIPNIKLQTKPPRWIFNVNDAYRKHMCTHVFTNIWTILRK